LLLGYQSDLSYLIKPTGGYLYPAVDIVGGLDAIQSNLQGGTYTTEYDFQLDIYKLIASAYDGHFAYTPDILGVFFFLRLFTESLAGGTPALYQIISVSTDGVSLPNVYSALDALTLAGQGGGYTPSPITQINGEDVEDWLNTYAATNGGGRQQDPDSNYNLLFPSASGDSVPSLVGQLGNAFAQTRTYQGSDTVLTFDNGTERHVITVAGVSADLQSTFARSVRDGPSFFDAFCRGDFEKELGASASASYSAPVSSAFPLSSSFPRRDVVNERQALSSFFPSASLLPLSSGLPISQGPQSSGFFSGAPSGSATPVPSSQVPYKAVPTGGVKGYSPQFPNPIVATDDFVAAGYFPDAQDDLAVLTLPSYQPSSPSQFSNIVRELLATAKANGKTKLIIDLRGNPGGLALMAYDTFKQLFPSMDPWGAGNYRANALLNFTGASLSEFYDGVSSQQAESQGTDSLYAIPPFNVENIVNKAAKDFPTWEDFFGPFYNHGDNYTALTRFDLSDPDQRQGFYIYGYGNDDKSQPQTFEAENIIMLQDGACASTCTLFAEMMKNQAHVRSVVVGGRKQTGPMQAIGGVKGANVFGMAYFYELAAAAVQLGSTSMQRYFAETFSSSMIKSTVQALNRAAPGGEFGVQASVNFRNNFRQGDSTNTPLQFVYEAADCRFFYTAEMYIQQELVWSKAYNAIWGNGDCVADSTGHPSAAFGTGYIEAAAPANSESDDTIFPSKNLGKAVKPSATENWGPNPTGGAAGLTVSMGMILLGLTATVLFV
jgi:hypothetical protein